MTSRYNEKHIVNECEQIKLKILPKIFINLIPIRMDQFIYDAVLIGDEKIVRLSWEIKAKEKKLKLLTLKSVKNFDFDTSSISKESTRIYIDSSLGDNEIRGEDFAKILNEKGFKQIHLASGYPENSFDLPEWLNYSGKDCPF